MSTDSGFNVPTIDIGPYLHDPSSSESSRILKEIREACENVGFFQLIGHNIPRALQDATFKGIASFFSLPIEKKRKVRRNSSTGAGAGGFEGMGTQGQEDGKLPDLSEVCSPHSKFFLKKCDFRVSSLSNHRAITFPKRCRPAT